MENTGKVLFKDDSQQWFVALGTRWIGPMPASDVYAKIVSQEISWAHFIWRKGQKAWARACDVPEFQIAAPSAPPSSLKEQVIERSQATTKPAASRMPPPPSEKNDLDAKIWFLHMNDTQYGPFSTPEIENMLTAGRITSRHYLWKEKMANWERVEKIAQFKLFLPATPTAKSATPENKRSAPRKPLIAKILLANDKTLVSAVCRDISIGGMQVLTDRAPGEVGEKIKLNVSPAETGKASTAQSSFRPFVAEGVIVRMLEDGRGFSFRFDKISEAAKKSISAYVLSNG
jgi:hypothetical protein